MPEGKGSSSNSGSKLNRVSYSVQGPCKRTCGEIRFVNGRSLIISSGWYFINSSYGFNTLMNTSYCCWYDTLSNNSYFWYNILSRCSLRTMWDLSDDSYRWFDALADGSCSFRTL
eukprot:TRINITY_DN2928_c0_g1_i2.p1 TRINITY_DN2928_c0_g1~~TRINITY_DN2928_c0_g1_i2.p1  ORF type:complete len:115 (-),score=2.41 TRINITY_DN2928_c0_g1_i2:360-704(-)